MSIKHPYLLGITVVAMAVALAACGQPGSSPAASRQAAASASVPARAVEGGQLEISSWGPQGTQAGKVFNAQPDGSAALWVRVNRSLDGAEATIDFNGAPLTGNISGNLVTASVPASLYATPGTYTVRVVAHNGSRSIQSNDVKFTVE